VPSVTILASSATVSWLLAASCFALKISLTTFAWSAVIIPSIP